MGVNHLLVFLIVKTMNRTYVSKFILNMNFN